MRRRNILAGLAALPAAGAVVAAGGAAVAHPGVSPGRRAVRSGVEVMAAGGYQELRGQRVGIISNPTGIFPDRRHEVDVMVGSGAVNVVAAFGPEHGFRGASQAGQGEEFWIDPQTGLPVYNAYNNKDKLADLFAEIGLDTVVFDIQDVGPRFYTFIWTMYLGMEAAAVTGKRFVVLDRPNPITGRFAAGPVLHPEHATFVGLKPISQLHGMTVGELAQLFNAEFLPEAVGRSVDLTVVPLQGWFRDMWYEETGLTWVAPSPNMPTVDTATVYPGTCLFEATQLSEGRGTTQPFELIGAPEIDHKWAAALEALDLPGAGFRQAYFKPTFSKWVGKTCGGVQVYVTDRDTFDPIRTAIAMIVTQRRLYPQYKWREASGTTFWMDKLTGSSRARLAIDAGADFDEVVAGWQDELAEFRRLREQHLLYKKTRGPVR